MQVALRPYLNSGVAIVGAGAIALAPLVVPPPSLTSVEQAIARAVFSDSQLLATVDPMATVSGSFDVFLGGLATSLGLNVTLDANGGVSLTDFMAALQAAITANPIGTLTDLFMLPATAISQLIGGLTGIPMPGVGGVVDTIAQLIAAPIRFGLESLMTGNDLLTGLITGGIDTASRRQLRPRRVRRRPPRRSPAPSAAGSPPQVPTWVRRCPVSPPVASPAQRPTPA